MARAPEPTPSALPSPAARALAFASIIVAGLCGALIGASIVEVQCTGRCGGAKAIGAIAGAAVAAIGVSVVAVLVLRAMGEWRRIEQEREAEAGEG